MSEVKRVNSIMNIDYPNRKNQYSIDARCIKRDRKNYSEKEARAKAMYLADKFENQAGIYFYLKVAWNLADWYIDWLVDYSQKKRTPKEYFVKVANMKMAECA